MPTWLDAFAWGLLGGSALVIGAAIAWLVAVPPKVVSAIMAFGAGVLISALAFDLAEEAADTGGLVATSVGFLGGGLAYVLANIGLDRAGARHRKRSAEGMQPSEREHTGSGTALAIGALIDGIPESVVLGATLVGGGGVSAAFVVAVFLSNLPEGLSSAAGMKRAGRSGRYVFGVWITIALVSAVSASLGFTLLDAASPETLAVIIAIAGGGILTMVADTMIPEAFDGARIYTGLITTCGFLTAFTVSQMGG